MPWAAILIGRVLASEFIVSKVDHTAVYRFACDFVGSVPAAFEQPALRLVARPVELVQACAYALGIAKRERPHVRSQWCMCPSI